MTAKKLLIGSTLGFVIALLLGGIYYSDTFVMSLADTSSVYAGLRIVIGVLLVSLLVTEPPRSLALRMIIGAWSVILAVLAFQLLMNYQLHLFDAVVFVEVAIIFAIEALESRRVIPVSKKHTPARKIQVLST